MTSTRRVLAVWGLTSATLASTYLFIGQESRIEWPAVTNSLMHLLAFLILVPIVSKEPVRANKFVFLNFAFFFGLSISYCVLPIVESIFGVSNPFIGFFHYLYVGFAAHYFLLSFAIVYLTLDTVFRNSSIISKYFTSFGVVAGFTVIYFLPVVQSPMALYNSPEIEDWRTLETAFQNYEEVFGIYPDVTTLSSITELPSLTHVSVNDEVQAERVADLYPYLFGDNYMSLVLNPLYKASIYMCIVCLSFIVLFFGYQYLKDPPQGAYVERIMFLMLLLLTVDIHNAWSYLNIVESVTLIDFILIGQYVSILIMAGIAICYALRLRFITSAKGEFYEQEINARPAGITRWRDALDNYFIEKIFSNNSVLGRLYADPARRRT